jgi:ABC-type antimicrobial peptide transport system ATPase subunit
MSDEYVTKTECAKHTETMAQEFKDIKKILSNHSTDNALMSQDIGYVKEKVDRIEHGLCGKADKWVEKAIVAVVIIFALGALYLIFDMAGIPR